MIYLAFFIGFCFGLVVGVVIAGVCAAARGQYENGNAGDVASD